MARVTRRLWPAIIPAVLTFAAGFMLGSMGSMHAAAADPAVWAPVVIHVPALASADLPPPAPGASLQSKIVSVADGATVQVQLGTVGKHYHANANEVQYIVQGQGKFWLGDSYRDVGPGDLIIIPKGTAHAATTTAFKAIAIKTPPQARDDVHPVP